MQKFSSWDEVLQAFRKLGGVADNVCFKSVNGRRGIFTVNPSLPCKLFIPEHAIIKTGDVEVDCNRLVLKQSANVLPEVRRFFDAYHEFSSWSDGGSDEIEAFLNDLCNLPEQIKNLLKSKFYFSDLLDKPDTKAVLDRFISTRRMTFKKKDILFPVLELANHATVKAAFENTDKGILLDGTFDSEVLVCYSLNDSWMRLKSFGFSCRERWAFSDPFSVTPIDGSMKISVRASIDEFIPLKNGLLAPIVKKDGKSIDISFIMLGDRADMNAPLRIFREHVKDQLGEGSEEFFETLAYINKLKFLELLSTCDGYDSPMISTLKTACHYQLEALNNIWLGDWASGRS